MNSQDGKIIVSRHGRKFTGMHGLNVEDGGIPVVPASLEDKAYIYITPEGGQELREEGVAVLGDSAYDNALFTVSDFVRALQSVLYFTEGANLVNGREIDQRRELGFAYDGSDMRHEKIQPSYSTDKAQFDQFIKNLYQDHYFKSADPKLPFMGEWLYQFVKSIGDGIERLQQTQGQEQSFLGHFTHTPNIDGLAMLALDCLNVDPTHRVVEVNDNYRGGVEMGEMFTGNIYNLGSTNPSIDLNVKGKVKGYNLSDLRRIEQEIQRNITV